jgi:hypothetical protein
MYGAPIFGKTLVDMFDSKKLDELEYAKLRNQPRQKDSVIEKQGQAERIKEAGSDDKPT